MIHSTAMVDPKAELHSDVEVGPHCIIGPRVRVGEGTKFSSHVVVEGNTVIGKNNTFFPFSVIGAIPQDLKYKGEDTRLVVGDNNTFRESVTLNLGTVQGGGVTKVGNHNLFMAYAHLGHDSIVGNHCILANAIAVAGHVVVQDYANLGGLVGVAQFCRVGAHSYVTGQAGVERDVPPFSIAGGQRPIVVRGANIVGLKRHGFDSKTIQTINEAIKLWIRDDVPKDRCLIEIESQYGDYPEVRELVGFIRESKAGVTK